MKSKKEIHFTYEGFLHNAWFSNDLVDEEKLLSFFNLFKQFSGAIHQTIPAFFILDYTKRKYILVSDGFKSITNHDPRTVLEGGLEAFLTNFHKDDFNVFNKNVFPININFLTETPQEAHHHYIFSNTYRYYNKDKTISNILQKSTFITSKNTKMPLFAIGTVSDISHLKIERNYLSHFIEKVNLSKNIFTNRRVVRSNHFYVYEEDGLLTPQEKSVLAYIIDGLSSKMIAEKLKISINTVNNHRQNILKKTNCKNVAQLIMYALQNKLI